MGNKSFLIEIGSLIFLVLLYSCGIKANPKPLEQPVVEVRRIGNTVFLRILEGEVVPEGFRKVENYWIREDAQSFCFDVKRVGGKKRRECIGGLTEDRVSLSIEYYEKKAKLYFGGFDIYQLYTLDGDRVNPWGGKQIEDKLELERDYIKKCYLVVGKRKDTYSSPTEFCLDPLHHPPIREVERLEYRILGDKLYLVWSYEPNSFFKEFVILENGREVGTTKAYTFELNRKNEKTVYKVKVRSIYGKESEGVSVLYSP